MDDVDEDRADASAGDPAAEGRPTPPPGATPATAPLRAWNVRVTSADALAWEMLPRELSGWRWAAFVVFLASAGAWVTLLTDRLGMTEGGWPHLALMLAAGGLHWLIATIVMNWRMRVRARRLVPTPIDVEVEDHVDHLLIRTTPVGGATTTRSVGFDLVRECLADAGRLFLHDVSGVTILPLAAFEDEEDMRARAATWEARADAAVE